MSINTLKYCNERISPQGVCVLCDKNISRKKFTNISQVETTNYDLILLSQIQHSQVAISSYVKDINNNKISLISNIYQMTENNFIWNNNFDVVSF
jgi:hypothetical protein